MSIEQLKDMTLPELKEKAKKLGIKGYSNKRKALIVDLLVTYYNKQDAAVTQPKTSLTQSFKNASKEVMSIAQYDIEKAEIKLAEMEHKRNQLIVDFNENTKNGRLNKRHFAKELNIISCICKLTKDKLKRLLAEIVVNPLLKKTCTLLELQEYGKLLYANSHEYKREFGSWFNEVFNDTAFFDEVI